MCSNAGCGTVHLCVKKFNQVTRLEYSEAQKTVTLGLRKAPEKTAVGFRQAANKLAIIIELLLGDIPDRKIFNEVMMRKSLEPYLEVNFLKYFYLIYQLI